MSKTKYILTSAFQEHLCYFWWIIVNYFEKLQNITMGCSNSQADNTFFPHAVNQTKQSLSKQYIQASQLISKGNFSEALKIGDALFQAKRFMEAIGIYKKIIEKDTNNLCQIEGLGNKQLAVSRYEWFVYEWYDKKNKQGKIQGNAYDALGLCIVCLRLRNQAPDKIFLPTVLDWYEDVLAVRPDYRLYLGYGHTLYALERFQQAIKIYNKVIQLRPKLLSSYLSIAMIHEYKRVQKPKSVAMANKVLQIAPSNMYAEFILARNQKSVDEKIESLKKAAERHPEFVKIVNEIGICYGATKKQYRQAIKWYEKCISIVPQYAACYNNIGVNHQLLKELQQAMVWYLKSCEKSNDYRQPYENLVDVFEALEYTDQQILAQFDKYPSIDRYKLYYNFGAALNKRRKYRQSIKWLEKAKLFNDKNTHLYNMLGMDYDDLRDYQNAELNYLKCVQLDPKYCYAYFNAGIARKNKGDIPKAIQYYQKAISINPKYSYAHHNLGVIYKDAGQCEKAIQYFEKAVEHRSTYTLALVNMAVCQLNLEQFQGAFDSFSRASEVLPSDNNNLTDSNKAFLRQSIAKFQKEGQRWRKAGNVDKEQKERLRQLINQFENKFKQVYSTFSKKSVGDEIALNKEVLQIVKLLSEDKFELKLIEPIYRKVKQIFASNEEYFHIIPQVFIQFFWNKKINEKRPILEVERFLKKTIESLSKLEMSSQTEEPYVASVLNFKFANFDPPSEASVNLFSQNVFFGSYEGLYNEIDKVNKASESSLTDFRELVTAVAKRSSAISSGVNMKLPKNPDQQFKVILRILEKMFKKEITPQKVESIIAKIDSALSTKKQITMITVVSEIMNIWTQQISEILKERMKNNTETKFTISDLVRGKLMFQKVEDLQKALKACEDLCKIRGFQIIEMSDRLAKKQTMDVVLKIKIKSAVCEFQLALEQDPSRYHLIHCIYEIERSPLGCIFGSYLFMSKGFSYPILSNCEDIEARLEDKTDEEHLLIRRAAQYVISVLTSKSREQTV